MRSILQLLDSPPAALATGAVLTYSIPLGKPLRKLHIYAARSNDTPLTRTELLAETARFEVLANTNKIIDLSDDDALALMNVYGDYAGAAADDGSVIIPFSRRHIRPSYGAEGGVLKILDAESLRFGTIGIRSMQLQVTLGTVTNLGKLFIYAEFADAPDELPGWFVRIVRSAESGFSTSERKVDGVTPNNGSSLLAMHIRGYGSGVLAQASVKHSERELQRYQYGAAASGWGLTGRILKDRGRLVQASYFLVDCLPESTLADAVPLDPLLDPRVMLTWSTAPDSGNFTAVIERLEEFGRTFGQLG